MAKIKRGLYILVFLLFLALPVVMYPYLGNKVDKENFEKRQMAEKPKLSIENFTDSFAVRSVFLRCPAV